jgi:hypothetical protein
MLDDVPDQHNTYLMQQYKELFQVHIILWFPECIMYNFAWHFIYRQFKTKLKIKQTHSVQYVIMTCVFSNNKLIHIKPTISSIWKYKSTA